MWGHGGTLKSVGSLCFFGLLLELRAGVHGRELFVRVSTITLDIVSLYDKTVQG